jgi:predicted enzyme related to lactoylglutathione lyase
MFRGLCHINYWTDDVEAATKWYSEVLGIEPYFIRPEEGPPAYVEFRLGDQQDEIGLIDRHYASARATSGLGGVVASWHVDDVQAALDRLLAMGATEYEPFTVRGEGGWVTASVVDPFGNIIGLIYSPHYLQMLGEKGPA